mgnify:FL=1
MNTIQMDTETKRRVDDLIDAHGSIALAIDSRLKCINRRTSEGKCSHRAIFEVQALENLPVTYLTNAQRVRIENDQLCGPRD